MEKSKERKMGEFVAFCKNCNIKTIFKEDHTYLKAFDIAPDGFVFENPEVFIFAFCRECQHPSLFIKYDFVTPDGGEEEFYERIFPPQKRKLDYQLPNIVRDSYFEAINCEQNHAWLASLVMIGRTLEAIMKEYYPDESNFYNGLERMHTDGVISYELLDWSHQLRKLRNISAHATDEEVTAIDASEALDFLQVILDTIYKYRPKFEKLKERRER